MVKKVLEFGTEQASVLSYKNFEQQLLHSLDAEDSRVSVSRAVLADFMTAIISKEAKEHIALQQPARNDPLRKTLEKLDEKLKNECKGALESLRKDSV